MFSSADPSIVNISGRSEVVSVDPSVVPDALRDVTIEQYFQVAIATVLIYDASEFCASCIERC